MFAKTNMHAILNPTDDEKQPKKNEQQTVWFAIRQNTLHSHTFFLFSIFIHDQTTKNTVNIRFKMRHAYLSSRWAPAQRSHVCTRERCKRDWTFSIPVQWVWWPHVVCQVVEAKRMAGSIQHSESAPVTTQTLRMAKRMVLRGEQNNWQAPFAPFSICRPRPFSWRRIYGGDTGMQG